MNLRNNDRGPERAISWKKVDISKGQCLTLGAIAEKYGIHFNRQVAVSAAIRDCKKCAKMKGSWVEYDEWGGIMTYFFITKEHNDVFKKAWEMYTEEESGWAEQDGSKTPEEATSVMSPLIT